jgi:hypothetical protein
MALPEQIRKQTEAVQELYNQLNNAENTGDEQNNAQDANDFQGGDTDAYDSQDVQADTSSGNEEASLPSGTEQTTGGKKKKSEETQTLAQKYRTLQGMYNAEVPRLHQQNRELVSRVQHLEQLLSTLTTSNVAASTTNQTVDRLVSDKDVEEYGESIDVMRKVSREEYIPVAQKISQLEQMLQRLQSNVVPQVQNLTQRQAASTEQQFWAQLSQVIPNWKQINDDPDFQTWLLQSDPLTGIGRQTILEDAQRNYDVARIASFFRTWSEISGQAVVAQNSQRNAPSSELEKQVAPGRGRSTGNSSTTNGTGKTYTPNDIRSFFESVRQGRYKGREQERDRIERDIFAAQREGRIIANA